MLKNNLERAGVGESFTRRLDATPHDTILIALRDNDVVEVAGHLHLAFLAVGSVPYTERPLHAGLEGSPRVDRVLGPHVSLSSGRRRGGGRVARRLDVHCRPVAWRVESVLVSWRGASVEVGC